MRICVGGLGKHADTLHVGLPKYAEWAELTSVLSIGGVTYYYTQGCMLGIRYNGSVDAVDVAAQALIVAAAFCDVSVGDVEVVVQDPFVTEVMKEETAREIQARMPTMSAPAEVPLAKVVPRGSGPAYYLQ